MMRKFLGVFVASAMIACSGCVKEEKGCTPVNPTVEEPQMSAYATANSYVMMKHPSGLNYQVVNPGTGSTPTVNSTVRVAYTGKLLNGTVFDQSTSFSNQLGGLIEGWKIGIPLIKKGGKIRLLIPSSLAYGCNDLQGIPGNSVLYFDVELLDVL